LPCLCISVSHNTLSCQENYHKDSIPWHFFKRPFKIDVWRYRCL
jgi:hypothetical protein